jgi:hypothetical protein
MNHKMRSIAAKNLRTFTTLVAVVTLVAVLLSTMPGSTLANTKSFSNSGSLEHSSHCRHNQFSDLAVNLFRHRLQTLQIMLTC